MKTKLILLLFFLFFLNLPLLFAQKINEIMINKNMDIAIEQIYLPKLTSKNKKIDYKSLDKIKLMYINIIENLQSKIDSFNLQLKIDSLKLQSGNPQSKIDSLKLGLKMLDKLRLKMLDKRYYIDSLKLELERLERERQSRASYMLERELRLKMLDKQRLDSLELRLKMLDKQRYYIDSIKLELERLERQSRTSNMLERDLQLQMRDKQRLDSLELRLEKLDEQRRLYNKKRLDSLVLQLEMRYKQRLDIDSLNLRSYIYLGLDPLYVVNSREEIRQEYYEVNKIKEMFAALEKRNLKLTDASITEVIVTDFYSRTNINLFKKNEKVESLFSKIKFDVKLNNQTEEDIKITFYCNNSEFSYSLDKMISKGIILKSNETYKIEISLKSTGKVVCKETIKLEKNEEKTIKCKF